MNIYTYCVDWVNKNSMQDAMTLDYGCGSGGLVHLLRAAGFESRGCDVFFEGGDYSSQVTSDLMAGGIIKRMDSDRIPFEDASFDLIINNQVMEHVANIDLVLSEINRVLKPGGKVLSLFPDQRVWREGHVGIPFLHWFPRGSRLQVYYSFALRCVGLGYHKQDKFNWQWSEDACSWINRWCYYRNFRDIKTAFQAIIGPISWLEGDYLAWRLGPHAWILKVVPLFVSVFVVRKLACLVFETRKAG
jgi:SAM-dependent methyltransferase